MSMQTPHDGAGKPDAAARALEEEPVTEDVPSAVRLAAKRAFALRDRAAVVLELASDSLLDDVAHDGPRELVFGGRDRQVTVAVRVKEAAGGLLLHLETGRAQVRELQVGEDVLEAEDLGDGRWIARVAAHGLFSVVVEADGQRARTSWLRV